MASTAENHPVFSASHSPACGWALMMETVAILFHSRISPHPFSAESLLLSPIRCLPPDQASGWISKPTSEKTSYFLLLIPWLTTCARKFDRQVPQCISLFIKTFFTTEGSFISTMLIVDL
jgi:hypothetical protein